MFFKDDQPDEDHPYGWQNQLGEVQAEINRRITENLHNLEHGDMKRLNRIVEMAPHVRKLYFGEELRKKNYETGPQETTPIIVQVSL